MSTLSPGDTAPAFELVGADGATVRLSDFGPGKVIVYFYPAALTPGCTTQAIDFTAGQQCFAEAGYRIVGISPDTVDKLAHFREKKALTIPLLADPQRQTLNAWGAWGTKNLYGKEVEGVIRSTFIVDVSAAGIGTIVAAHYRVRATGHVARIAQELGVTLPEPIAAS